MASNTSANAILGMIGGKDSSSSSLLTMQVMEKRKKKSLICCFDSSSVYKTQRIFQAVASKSQVKNALTQPALPQYDDSNVLESSGRRQGGHLPRPWGSEFINSFSSPYSYETHGSRLEELKQSAKKLFDSTKEPRDQLDLINTIQRLGLAHHFEDEIKHVLSQLVHPDIADDLPTVALQFRLLRQNGFFVTTDLFNKFMEEEGKFMESLGENISGILSLYEASFLGMPGEHVLDEARNFSAKHLKTALKRRRLEMGDHMAAQVEESLEMPLHWRNIWTEARNFIDIYQRDHDKMNSVLLEFAKLNYNILQSVYLKELQELAGWWKDLNLKEKLPFARDRLIEAYIWAMMGAHEVQFYKLRRNIAKMTYILAIVDDIFDTYGSLDELEKYMDTINRWDDLEAIEELPEYMKIIYKAMYNHVNEVVHDALEDKCIDILPYMKNLFVGQTEALLQEAKWIHGGCSPTTDEYLQISWITIGGPITLNYAILGVVGQYSMNKFLSEFIDHYLVSDLVCVPGLMGRLLNDLSTRKDEMKRGETLNFINCYMVQEGVSEEEARDHLEGLIRNLWKKLNKLIIEYSVDAPSIPKVVVNVTRSAHHIYRGGKYDWFGVRPKADLVSMLNSIFEPIPM